MRNENPTQVKIDNNQAALQQAITANQNSKSDTYNPKSSGNTKDTIWATNFIKHIEEAAIIGNWNKTRQCEGVKCEGNALILHNMDAKKDTEHPAIHNWDTYTVIFIKYYEARSTTRLKLFALHQLKQT